jgi:acetoin utilization deacetylase AcuC-like enzyme
MSTGFHWNERYAWHDTGTGAAYLSAGGLIEPEMHGESPATKRRLRNLLDVTGLLDRTTPIQGRSATREELLRVHSADYLDRIERESQEGGGNGGENAPFGAGGYDICALSAGGVLATVEAVWNRDVDNAYSLSRPPGHHAERGEGRGFCLLANIPVAIQHARAELGARRVAVVDWDVHHGNGTENIFYEDPNVLTLSIHQAGLFPAESGGLERRGGGDGFGANINLPLPPGCGDGAYLATIQRVVIPALETFRPEMIVIACGLDACMLDPLAMMMVTSEGYRAMTDLMLDAADRISDGRLVAVHEGGYSSAYVPFCGAAVIEGLLRSSESIEDPFIESYRSMEYVDLQPHQERVISIAESGLSDVARLR